MTPRDREEFIARLAREIDRDTASDFSIVEFARMLMRAGRTLNRIAVEECNGFRSQAIEEYCKRKEERLQKRVTEACERMGCGVEFNEEPRGCPLFVKVPSGETNDWGQRGIAVPTSD